MTRPVPGRVPARLVLLGCAAAAALACDRVMAPQRHPRTELRRQATAGLGALTGRVRTLDSAGRCWWRTAPVVPGVRVEVGLWDGSPAFYRDTITGRAPTSLDDHRFQVLAHTVTDAEGRFRFDSLPRQVAYATRVIAPEGSFRGVAYGETMFGVPEGGSLEDFPTLCVPTQ